MDIDAFANIVGKAMTLIATFIALRLGGGLTEVILMEGVGGISILLVGAIAARRLDITVKAPVMKAVRELLRHGAPIAAFSLVIASQSFIEIVMLSAFTSPAVVGWFGAFRSIFGIVISPAMILLAAAFPQLSRASLSLPDFRRMIDATGRVMFIAAAFTSSALYLFADDMVAIIYGHGRFEQTASILRVSAIFIPLLFFGYFWQPPCNAVGRNKAMAVISIVRIALCVVLSWLLIDYWQQRFGNGAIALVIITGVAEIPALIACWLCFQGAQSDQPRRSIWFGLASPRFARSFRYRCCSRLGSCISCPLFALLFAVTAMVTRLVLPSDLRLVMEIVRSRVLAPGRQNPPRTADGGDAGKSKLPLAASKLIWSDCVAVNFRTDKRS